MAFECTQNLEIEQVNPALSALEALGPALEDHLQLLLPALVRLICPGAPF